MTSGAFSRRKFIQTSALAILAAYQSPLKALAAAQIPFENWDTLKPYLHGIYGATGLEQITPLALNVIGKIPDEIDGAYFRNGPNPRFTDYERHHWFDGDGMVHKVRIQDGQASYQNRYVLTEGLQRELDANRRLFYGLDEIYDKGSGSFESLEAGSRVLSNEYEQGFGGSVKDTANTDLIMFRGKLIPLWWLSGKPYTMDPETLETTGVENFGGTYSGRVSAHARIDPATGELFFLDFGQLGAYVSVHCVSSGGKHKWSREFKLPYPRIYHDILFTRDYVVLLDFPLGYLKNKSSGRTEIAFDTKSANAFSRIVLINRKSPAQQISYTFPATYVLHGINAFQENGKVTLFVCKYTDPIISHENDSDQIPKVGLLRVETVTARWDLELPIGDARARFSETIIDDANTEFPRMNDQFLGRASRFCYSPRLDREPVVRFGGLIKYDLFTGAKSELKFGNNWVGEEAAFIPKENAESEDDGWVATFAHCLTNLKTEYRIYDAKSMDAEPVARVLFPAGMRVPHGFHSKWVPSQNIDGLT